MTETTKQPAKIILDEPMDKDFPVFEDSHRACPRCRREYREAQEDDIRVGKSNDCYIRIIGIGAALGFGMVFILDKTMGLNNESAVQIGIASMLLSIPLALVWTYGLPSWLRMTASNKDKKAKP